MLGVYLFICQFVLIGGFLLGRYKFPVKPEPIELVHNVVMTDTQFSKFMQFQKDQAKVVEDEQKRMIKDYQKSVNEYLTGDTLDGITNFNY